MARPLDAEADAVIVKDNQCPSCGNWLDERARGGYCHRCVRDALETERQRPDPDQKAELARQELARRELCRRRLLPFTVRMVPNYHAGWFHTDLAARLERFSQRVVNGESPRLIINVPPRHGKSELASKAMIAWHLGRHPDHRIISATHSDRLAMDNSRDVLNYLKDPRYKQLFETSLNKDNQGAMGWRTNQGGMYKPVGAGAGISGYGAHIFVIDDPHRDKDAYSPAVRDTIWQWYKSSARTRLLPGGGIVLIQTRWVMDDLTGRVLDEEGRIEEGGQWEVVCYPAIAIEDEYRLPDGTLTSEPGKDAELLRREGEPLHPQRYTLESFEEAQQDPVVWQALYQQRPTAGDAAQFSEEMLERCACKQADIPKRLTYYAIWDTAQGLKEIHDYNVGLVIGVDKNETMWFVDLVRDRYAPDVLIEEIIDLYVRYRPVLNGIEKTQYVVGLETSLEARIAERRAFGMAVELLSHGNKDKVARSKPIQSWMRRGKVKIPTDAPWYAQMKKELLEFPGGRHDDIVDAVSYAGQLIDTLETPFVEQPKRENSWRDKLAAHTSAGGRSWRTA